VSHAYFDVIVLGSDLPGLACGALLAKRGFRVLVLGQQQPAPSYRLGPYTLPRRPFTFGAVNSPVAKRTTAELGIGPHLRRLSRTLEPAYQIALPRQRLEIPTDLTQLEREIEREFSQVRRPALDFFRLSSERARATDALFERNLPLPPVGFWERRELQRAAAGLDIDRDGHARDLLAELPDRHPFRAAAMVPACFAGNLEPERLTELLVSRLIDSLASSPHALAEGLSSLSEVLCERIRSGSGELRFHEHAAQILVRRSAVCGVRLHGSDEEIGASTLIASLDVSAISPLLEDRRPMLELFEQIGEPQPRHYRYTLNVVIGEAGLPEGMARDVYVVRNLERALSGENVLHVEVDSRAQSPGAPAHHVLCVETLLHAGAVEGRDGSLDTARERVLSALAELMPFVREHALLWDSPHDGRAPSVAAGEPPATDVRDRRGPETMPCVHAYPVTSAMGLCAMPVRTGLAGLLLCGSQVVPGLGLEGELLAASAAANVVSRKERARPWVRRRLWPKVET
jgi:phytoene dehydrogenase-like protein